MVQRKASRSWLKRLKHNNNGDEEEEKLPEVGNILLSSLPPLFNICMSLQVKFKDLLKLNQPDWLLVTVGIIVSGIVGALFPLMSIFFSEMLEVSGGG